MSPHENHFDVVWPLGRSTETAIALNARFANNKPKRIGFLWDYIFRGDQMFPLIQAGLPKSSRAAPSSRTRLSATSTATTSAKCSPTCRDDCARKSSTP